MSDLIQIIKKNQETFQQDAAKAQVQFQSESKLQDGLRSLVKIRQHRLTIDEPNTLGGSDQGANPVEVILAALGTCHEITFRAYAAALAIPLKSVRSVIKGNIDLRGFFAVSEEVRPGYQNIEATLFIDSDASDEQLEQLHQAVTAHCPVYDIIKNKTELKVSIERE